MGRLRLYLLETFEPTILFGFFSALVGVFAAWHYRSFDGLTAALAIIGAVCSQIAVNLIDDYVDYKSGLDSDTEKTKFSGGSALVSEKLVKPGHVILIGMSSFAIALAIGIYLTYVHLLLLPIVMIGGLTILLYAKYLARVPFFAEPLTALNFALVCIGAFIASGGQIGRVALFLFPAIGAGMQVGVATVVNYLPDREADRKHGRRNVVVMLNSNKGNAVFYLALQAIAFFLVIAGVYIGAIPAASLAVLLTAPVVWSIACAMVNYKSPRKYERAMANAVLAELVFMLIIAISFA